MVAHIGLGKHPALAAQPRRTILVKRCTSPGAWYERLVGQEVECEFVDHEGYWAREGGIYNCINKIKLEDAEVTLVHA